MKLKFLILVFLSLAIIFPSIATAGKAGQDIYFDCSDESQNSSDPMKQIKFLSCVSYIDGLYEMYMLFNTGFKLKMSCPPPAGISNEQLRLMFLKYIKENPKEMNETARTVLFGMIKENYPCATKP